MSPGLTARSSVLRVAVGLGSHDRMVEHALQVHGPGSTPAPHKYADRQSDPGVRQAGLAARPLLPLRRRCCTALTYQEVDSVQVRFLQQAPQLGLCLGGCGVSSTRGRPLPQHLLQVEHSQVRVVLFFLGSGSRVACSVCSRSAGALSSRAALSPAGDSQRPQPQRPSRLKPSGDHSAHRAARDSRRSSGHQGEAPH